MAISKLGLKKNQLKNSAIFKVRFKKFKNGALVAILENGGYVT